MLRSVVVLLVASVALTTSLSAGASPTSRHVTTAEADQVSLRAKFHQGPWKKSLSLRLVKLRLISFQLCAIWNYQAGAAFDCDAAARNKLPAGTIMEGLTNPVATASGTKTGRSGCGNLFGWRTRSRFEPTRVGQPAGHLPLPGHPARQVGSDPGHVEHVYARVALTGVSLDG